MRQFVLVTLLASIAACATPGKDTAIGAGVGAGGGALIGGLAGGWEGAAIGAVAGGLVGGAIGNYLDKQQQELQQISDARRTESGLLLNLRSTLIFTKDSAVVQPAAVEELARLGDVLAKYPQDRIIIEGFAEPSGSTAHDEALSLRRAEAVRDILASRGVGPRQMLVEGAGATQPIADNSTPEGRAQNRSVAIHIVVPQS
jgi:outer membrane protein OmpA-like peptidoglycan-associated protein